MTQNQLTTITVLLAILCAILGMQSMQMGVTNSHLKELIQIERMK